MNVSITGGSGFIGRKLVEFLVQQGHTVSVLSRRSSGNFPADVRVIQGDLTRADCLLDSFLDGCEVLMHCAGELKDEEAMMDLHVGGTERLLKAALEKATQKKNKLHWVQLSSVGAYGTQHEYPLHDRIVTEDTLCNPYGLYEVTKTQSDELVIEASRSGLLTYSIVRPSIVFAADMTNTSLHSLGAIIRRGLFFYIGSSGAVATYVHADDVIEVMLRCATDNRAKGNIYNISNDCLLEDMIESIAFSLKVPSPRLRFPEPLIRSVTGITAIIPKFPLTPQRINALVNRTRYPYFKLERELGFFPQISVPDAIAQVVVSK